LTMHTLIRVPLQGTEDVVGRGSPGFHPGLSPVAPSGHEAWIRRNAAHGESPGWSGAEPWVSPPSHLAPTGRTVTPRTVFRVPFQGTEDVVWRGPRGSTPGFRRSPLQGQESGYWQPGTLLRPHEAELGGAIARCGGGTRAG
jgi:hypothetical protein